MGCEKPDLRKDISVGMERQKKILKLMDLWYGEATQSTPPPANDPSVLSYNALCTYYFTSQTQNESIIAKLITDGLKAVVDGLTGVTIDVSAITNVVSSALANATKNETNQGYSTCSLQSFQGKFENTDCLYKPMVVAVSFNFSASEYETDENVTAMAYWIYLLCTGLPFQNDSEILCGDEPSVLTSVHGEELKYEIPPDMSIVGREYMTLEQLDQYNP